MFVTIVIAVLFILTTVSLVVAKVEKDAEVKTVFKWLSGVIGVATFIVFIASTYTAINPTSVGIPVNFGKVGAPLNPGISFVAPWTTVEKYPTRPINVELAGDNKIIARTADAGQMSVEVAVRWKVLPQDAKTLYFQARTDDQNSISDNIVIPSLRQAVGEIYSVTGNLDAISDRTRVAQAILVQIDKQLLVYGITVTAVNIRSVEPDTNTAATISQYASQQQATRIATEAIKTATAEAQRRLIEAKGLKAAAGANSGLTSGELQSICLQVWQQVNLQAIAKGQTLYTSPCGAGATVIAK